MFWATNSVFTRWTEKKSHRVNYTSTVSQKRGKLLLQLSVVLDPIYRHDISLSIKFGTLHHAVSSRSWSCRRWKRATVNTSKITKTFTHITIKNACICKTCKTNTNLFSLKSSPLKSPANKQPSCPSWKRKETQGTLMTSSAASLLILINYNKRTYNYIVWSKQTTKKFKITQIFNAGLTK